MTWDSRSKQRQIGRLKENVTIKFICLPFQGYLLPWKVIRHYFKSVLNRGCRYSNSLMRWYIFLLDPLATWMTFQSSENRITNSSRQRSKVRMHTRDCCFSYRRVRVSYLPVNRNWAFRSVSKKSFRSNVLLLLRKSCFGMTLECYHLGSFVLHCWDLLFPFQVQIRYCMLQ